MKESTFNTSEVYIGDIPMGGSNPIRLQSMTTTGTLDVEATVAQCIAIANAGADYVRITAPGVREAEALQAIKAELKKRGYSIPLIADIHFNPAAAEVAARYVEKVRINPGNFVDKVGSVDEPTALREKFIHLLHICREHQTALRIGVNHGSLSARMLNRYGDTPQGMVESALEFLRICKEEKFADVVVSMKSSNTRVMVYATRMLAQRMAGEGMSFPLHLGVTEAGEGEDGRVKSAVGIGTLLAEGLGDTIRVSLTEEPQNEIPVAKKLAEYFEESRKTLTGSQNPVRVIDGHNQEETLLGFQDPNRVLPAHNFFDYQKRETTAAGAAPIGGGNPVAVVADLSNINPIKEKDIENLGFTFDGWEWKSRANTPDVLYVGLSELDDFSVKGLKIIDGEQEDVLHCRLNFINSEFVSFLKENPQLLLILDVEGQNGTEEQREFFLRLEKEGVTNPLIIHRAYREADYEALQLKAAADVGALLIDGFGDGVMLSVEGDVKIQEVVKSVRVNSETLTGSQNPVRVNSEEKTLTGIQDPVRVVEQTTTFTRSATPADLCHTGFGILQAARVRFSKTEYIACPGCGRTLFELQKTLQEVKQRTSQLKGLRIAVMGCIVNGPGEMADADYGYVGAGPGRVSLYKGKECVEKNIEQERAVEALVELIKRNGDWK